ncbi:MAG: 5-formyltetrahydrofolate cyclo-ligase [Betaproteobacteria bacterium]|nr:5-formyltetrahydrofolate cyclo-ligase [Betaproteobacteria bacterium]
MALLQWGLAKTPTMSPDDLRAWRKAERKRLIAVRTAIDPVTLGGWRARIDAHLESAFADLASGVVALCWPVLAEYDGRYLARKLRERGAVTALPVVVAPRTPLAFREWHPGVLLAEGAMKIPYPVDSREVVPDTVLLPMNGWDAQGYRLGYGAGFFDRTLASLAVRPRVIGVTFELARMETIHPQSWDIPADFVVTERGCYRRATEGRLVPGPGFEGN